MNSLFANLGPVAILTLTIIILGLVFRMKLGRALKSGFLAAAGYLGLTLVVDLLNASLKPTVDHFAKAGTGYTVVDIGWPAAGVASWALPLAVLAVPLMLLMNLGLIRLGWTRTLNVDIWNFMHLLIPGALVYTLFRNFWAGLIVILVLSVIALLIGDHIASKWQEHFGLDGATCTTLIYSAWVLPIAWLVNKVIDLIPGLNKWDIPRNKWINKMGAVGEPAILGFCVGLISGLIAKRSVAELFTMAAGTAAVMVLMPKVVAVMVDGLSPIGKSVKEFMTRRSGNNANLNVGMDISLGLGDQTTITNTLYSIPLILILALVLPGVKFFPLGVFMSVTYISVMSVLAGKGNLFRSVVSNLVICTITFYLGGYVAPAATVMLTNAGIPLDSPATDIVFSEIWNVLIYWLSTVQ
jgi:PTS system galactitol-specific IIC component